MSAFRDGSAEIEGGCVCFVATADQKFIRIGFSPRVMRRSSDIRRLDLGVIQKTSEPLKMLGYIPGTPATEQWLHRRFRLNTKPKNGSAPVKSCDFLSR